MDFMDRVHHRHIVPCTRCGNEALIGIFSIGTPHQFIEDFLCSTCVTEEELRDAKKEWEALTKPDSPEEREASALSEP